MDLKKYIRSIPDYPKKGILFRDITTLIKNPEAFKYTNDKIIEFSKKLEFDKVSAIESRGFIFASTVSYILNKPFILLRKKNKLPSETHSVDFKLEYGKAWNKDTEKKDIILADEISPDTCRLWDSKTEKKLDKDRFRKDLGNIIQGYQEVARRLGIMPEETNISEVNFGKTIPIKFKKK